MANREKVVKGLEQFKADFKPFCGNGSDWARVDDALALLKEQEEDKPKGRWIPFEPDKRGYTNGFTCSRCERVILSDHYCKMIDFDFCPFCGACMDNAEGR